jgi:hypothetical protein
MKVRIQIDATGWVPADPPQSPPRWQSVTCDEMKIQAIPLEVAFPQMSDLVAVRRHFQHVIRTRGGGLISCDVVPIGDTAIVRTVSKYRAGQGYAMAYTASLTVPLAGWVIELLISGSEDNLTGLREAVVTSELSQMAGPSQQRQLAQNVFPIEWKFERYEPGTRGDLAYLVSDDDKYDARFPEHPLSRVRRWLRRQERAFEVTPGEEVSTLVDVPRADSTGKAGRFIRNLFRKSGSRQEEGGLHVGPAPEQTSFEVRQLELKPMGFEEIVRELGSQVAADAVMAESFRRLNPPVPLPPLPTRQKMYREQRDAAAKKILEQQQERAAQAKQVREDAEVLLRELTGEEAYVALARERSSGKWYTIREGNEAQVLAVFTSAASVDDFISCKAMDCEPVRMNVRDLFASLSESHDGRIAALEFDRCPRCADVRPVVQLSAIPSEGALLRLYAVHVAGRKVLVEKNLRVALQEPVLAKQLAVLRYTVEHIDPGAAGVHVELAKLALASGNAALLEESKRILAKYFPDHLASLDVGPANSA